MVNLYFFPLVPITCASVFILSVQLPVGLLCTIQQRIHYTTPTGPHTIPNIYMENPSSKIQGEATLVKCTSMSECVVVSSSVSAGW